MCLQNVDQCNVHFPKRIECKKFLSQNGNALTGIYFENYLAIELNARRIGLFYWKGKRDSEFEFILDMNGHIVPVDVKKGKGSLNSLEEFCHLNKNDLAIKVSSDQYGYDSENKVLNLPFYDVPFALFPRCLAKRHNLWS